MNRTAVRLLASFVRLTYFNLKGWRPAFTSSDGFKSRTLTLFLLCFFIWWSFLVCSTHTEVMRKIRCEVTRKLGFRILVLLSCLAFRCVLAITRRSLPRRAQAMEGEAEKLQLLFRYLDRS